MLLTAFLFGQGIFSGTPMARYLPSAFVALMILVGGSLGEGADFTEKFFLRVVLIGLAAIYIVTALSIPDRFIFRKK